MGCHMIRRRNQSVLVLLVVSALASFANAEMSTGTHKLEEGKVRFVCEGPEVTVPAWGQSARLRARFPLTRATCARRRETSMCSWCRSAPTIRPGIRCFAGRASSRLTTFQRAGSCSKRCEGRSSLEPGKWVPMTLEGRFALHGINKKVSVPATVKVDTGRCQDWKRRAHSRSRELPRHLGRV